MRRRRHLLLGQAAVLVGIARGEHIRRVGTATRRPGSFSLDPKPLMKSVSPWMTGTDFISNDRPPTHQTRLPVSAS